MKKCKFLGNNCECWLTGDFSYPDGASIMGYCMVTVENRVEECNWFTEVE